MKITGFRAMWVVVLFDLPVGTKRQRKLASEFRRMLVQDGFWMMQFSVYARPCPSEENASVHQQRVEALLPPEGKVRMLAITDRQFGRMRCFHAGSAAETEGMPQQLEFF
jgi:CRISPR-associated protein Cas2